MLKLAGLDEDIEDQHVRFHSMDGMMASIGTEKALNPYGDCIVAYEMNGEPLPRDHGVRGHQRCDPFLLNRALFSLSSSL